MKINILLPNNFVQYHTSYCFVYPIIKSINLIKESEIKINFIYSIKKNIFDCNILITESRFCGGIEKKKFINYLKKNKNKKLKKIAINAQKNYLIYTTGKKIKKIFAKRFLIFIKN